MYIHSTFILFNKSKYLVQITGKNYVIFLLNKYAAVKRVNKSLENSKFTRSNKIIRNWREY